MRSRQNISEGTLMGDLTAINNLYHHVEVYREADPELSKAVVTTEIDPASYQTRETVGRKPLSMEQVRQLLEATETLIERLVIQVALELGPRNKAIRCLKVSDVNLRESEVTLTNHKAGGRYTLPLSDQLKLFLRRWINVVRAGRGPSEDNPYLFPSRYGGNLSGEGIRAIVRRVAERAGIQEVVDEIPLSGKQKEMLGSESGTRRVYRVDVHTLRHTFNKLLSESGLERETRSAALDHSDPQTTKEHYEHNPDKHQELIEELFDGVSGLTNDDER